MYGGNATSNPNYINDTERRIFAGMVTCMDEGIGNITKALKKYNLFDENLIVIFSSDNGGPIPSNISGTGGAIGARNWPLRGGKHSIWEGGTRLTGFIWATNDIISKNNTNINGNYSELMHAADWLPTLIDASGIDINNVANISDIDGVSQWDAILGKYDDKYIYNNYLESTNGGARFDVRQSIYYGRNAGTNPGNYTGYQSMGYKILNNTGGAPSYWYAPVGIDIDDVKKDISDKDNMDIKYNMLNSSNGSINYMLFNLTNDPTEHYDISSQNTDLVTKLVQEMTQIKATGVPQGSNDRSCTKNISHPVYPVVGGVWEPWC